jgi:hypothetical protein
MNIFALDPSPATSAMMHCDQHLNKMILESAQMLSVAATQYCKPWRKPFTIHDPVYKPTHVNHPCNVWLRQNPDNVLWLTILCQNLNHIRESFGADPHKSMQVIKFCFDEISTQYTFVSSRPKEFIFVGSPEISIKPGSVHDKYKAYYRQKYLEWLDKGLRMSYKGRPIPEFMQDLITPSDC